MGRTYGQLSLEERIEHYRLYRSLGVNTCFCDVGCPQQNGGVENAIGRLRRLIPRKTNRDVISNAQLRAHVDRLNNIPRNCLGFRTSAEVFSNLPTGALQT